MFAFVKSICYNLIRNVFHFLLDLTCTMDIIYFLWIYDQSDI